MASRRACVKVLLEAGANVNKKVGKKTILRLAETKEKDEFTDEEAEEKILRLLREAAGKKRKSSK